MIRRFLFLSILFSLAVPLEKKEIVDVLEEYNEAFGEAQYSEIISFFDFPVFFNLQDKTIKASHKLKLRLIYKKLRGSLPNYYSHSKWDKLNIQLVDDNIAIVYADFSRYNTDNVLFYSGSALYHLRLKDGEWKIFSLTPYENIKILD